MKLDDIEKQLIGKKLVSLSFHYDKFYEAIKGLRIVNAVIGTKEHDAGIWLHFENYNEAIFVYSKEEITVVEDEIS